MDKKSALEMFIGKYEIHHRNPKTNRIQYNSYHNCWSPTDAIKKHEDKGFLKSNITKITHFVKHVYTKEQMNDLIS